MAHELSRNHEVHSNYQQATETLPLKVGPAILPAKFQNTQTVYFKCFTLRAQLFEQYNHLIYLFIYFFNHMSYL